MKAKIPLTLLLCALLLALGFSVLAEDEDEERRSITIQRLGHPDCKKLIQLHGSEHGPFAIALGSHGYLGVEISSLTPELLAHFGVTSEGGVLISRVEEDSPAFQSGLQVGDVVTRIGGEDVTSPGELSHAVREMEEGEVVDVHYWRGGQAATASVTVAERERCGFDMSETIDIDLEGLPHLDLSGILRQMPRIHLGEEAMGDAMKHLGKMFENRELEHQLESLEDVDLHEIEERLREVTERLQELEIRIDEEKVRADEKKKDGGDVY